MDKITETLLEAAKPHVPFDGWTDVTFQAVLNDTGIDPAQAQAAIPRGAKGLALAYHAEGDAQMIAQLAKADLDSLRYRDRVALAITYRLEAADKELVRRGLTLFALPQNAPDGATALWGTADAIWTALGDTSRDINWYSKRAILSGVYSSTLLYWLGDDSAGHENTQAFLERRINDVMQFETLKAKAHKNSLFNNLMNGPLSFISNIKAPTSPTNMPGSWRR